MLWQGLERAALSSVACHPSLSHLVAFACTDGKVGLYDIEARHVIAQCTAHNRAVRTLEWRRVSSTSAPVDTTLDLDDASTSAVIADVYVLYSFSDDGVLLSHRACLVESTAQQQQQQQRRCVNVTETYFGVTKSNELSCVAWNANGRLLAGAFSAGSFFVWYIFVCCLCVCFFLNNHFWLGFLSVILLNVNEIEDDDDTLRKHTTSIDSAASCLRWLDIDLLYANNDSFAVDATLACGCESGVIVIFSITFDAIVPLCVLQGKKKRGEKTLCITWCCMFDDWIDTCKGHGARVEALRWRPCLPLSLLSASLDSVCCLPFSLLVLLTETKIKY